MQGNGLAIPVAKEVERRNSEARRPASLAYLARAKPVKDTVMRNKVDGWRRKGDTQVCTHKHEHTSTSMNTNHTHTQKMKRRKRWKFLGSMRSSTKRSLVTCAISKSVNNQQGVNHQANEQMVRPSDACRSLLSKVRGIPGWMS